MNDIESRSIRLKAHSELLECQYGLLTKLLSREVLSEKQLADITESGNPFKQNNSLIEIIHPLLGDESKYQGLLESLRETGQDHLASIINDGEVPSNRPLNAAELKQIRVNLDFLQQNIDLRGGFLNELLSAAVITSYHQQCIEAIVVDFRKMDELLKIIQHRSFEQYLRFIACLHKSNQHHVAHVLENDGVVTAIDASIDKEYARRIRDAFSKMSAVEAKQQIVRELQGELPDGVELVGVKDGHSVRLYFLCQSLEALHALRGFLESEPRETYLEFQLVSETKQQHTIAQKVNRLPPSLWKEVLFKALEIKAIDRKDKHKTTTKTVHPERSYGSRNTSVAKLDADVLEEILLKVFMFRYRRDWDSSPSPGSVLYRWLASVSVRWRMAMHKKLLLRRLRQHVNAFNRQCVLFLSAKDYSLVSAKDYWGTKLILPLGYGTNDHLEMCLSLLSYPVVKSKDQHGFPETDVLTSKLIPVAENVFIDIDALDKVGYPALGKAAYRGYNNLYRKLIKLGAEKKLPKAGRLVDMVVFAAGYHNDLESLRDLFNDCYQAGTHDTSMHLMWLLLQKDLTGTDAALALLTEHAVNSEARFGQDINLWDSVLQIVPRKFGSKAVVVKFLLAQGADVKLIGSEGRNILHSAAKAGQLDALKFVLHLENAPNVTARAQYGFTLFHYAAVGGNVHILELLSDMGCFDPGDRTEHGESAIHIAARYGRLDAVKYLLQHGLDMKWLDVRGMNVLHTAAKYGQVDVLKYLLKTGDFSDVMSRSQAQTSLFHHAAASGIVEILHLLSEIKCFDINDRTGEGETALHIAAKRGKLDAVQLIIERDADIYSADIKGRNALHLASQFGQASIVKLLITLYSFADMNALSADGWTLLHHAACGGDVDILNMLLKKLTQFDKKLAYHRSYFGDIDINSIADDGCTALHLAVQHGKLDSVKFLLEHGADIQITDNQLRNVLHMAAEYSHTDMFTYLLSVTDVSDIKALSGHGWNILHHAAYGDNAEIIKLLMESSRRNEGILASCNFSIDSQTEDGDTALDIAAERGNRDTIKLLSENGADIDVINDKGRDAGIVDEEL